MPCGNCKWFTRKPPLEDNMGLCEFPLPPLPFWSTYLVNGEHWMAIAEGKDCPTWLDKHTPSRPPPDPIWD